MESLTQPSHACLITINRVVAHMIRNESMIPLELFSALQFTHTGSGDGHAKGKHGSKGPSSSLLRLRRDGTCVKLDVTLGRPLSTTWLFNAGHESDWNKLEQGAALYMGTDVCT